MSTEGVRFSRIAALLNHSRSTYINLQPRKEQPGEWALYEGLYRVHMSETPFEVLSLQASVSNEGLEYARRVAFEEGRTQVVYAPSLDRRPNRKHRHRQLFESMAGGFWNTRQYLASFLREELIKYRDNLSNLDPEFFIDPRIETGGKEPREYPHPLRDLFRRPEGRRSDGAGTLAVLHGTPGHGKTYLCRHVVARQARGGGGASIPIYVNSEQWQSLTLEDLGSLWKTILNAFRFFEAPIPWIEGAEEQFLSTTLASGLFGIVFDGFDEYILRNGGRVSAKDALDVLVRLARETSSRVLVTSRTTFWQTDLPSPDEDGQADGMEFFRLAPFDVNHAQKYFQVRFAEDTPAVNRATGLYAELRRYDEDLVGRGFVLRLVADLVQQWAKQEGLPPEEARSVKWLIEQFCVREEVRQRLPIDWKTQLDVMRLFAAEVLQGEPPTTATLEFALQLCLEEAGLSLSAHQIADVLYKLTSHPLIGRLPRTDRWHLREEQVWYILVAQYLLALGEVGHLQRFLQKATLNPETLSDLASMVVTLRSVPSDREGTAKSIADFVTLLLQPGPATERTAKQLAAHVALVATERATGRGVGHGERSRVLLSFLPDHRLRFLHLAGTIARFDFGGCVFESCYFDHVNWTNCQFTDRTHFKGCTFEGGTASFCRGMAEASRADCILDSAASDMFREAEIAAGQRRYGEEDLRVDMQEFLNKFLTKGRLGIQSVHEENLGTGRFGRSVHRAAILKAFKARVIEDHNISGGGKAFHVRHESKGAVLNYGENNVFTGPLEEVFRELKGKVVR